MRGRRWSSGLRGRRWSSGLRGRWRRSKCFQRQGGQGCYRRPVVFRVSQGLAGEPARPQRVRSLLANPARLHCRIQIGPGHVESRHGASRRRLAHRVGGTRGRRTRNRRGFTRHGFRRLRRGHDRSRPGCGLLRRHQSRSATSNLCLSRRGPRVLLRACQGLRPGVGILLQAYAFGGAYGLKWRSRMQGSSRSWGSWRGFGLA